MFDHSSRMLRRWAFRFAALLGAVTFAAAADSADLAPAFLPNHLFVGAKDLATNGAAVFEFDEAGAFVRKIDIETGFSGDEIYGLAFGPDGALYGAAHVSQTVVRIDATLQTSVVADSSKGMGNPVGVAFGPGGRLYVASRNDGGTVLALDGLHEVVDTYTAPPGKKPSFVTIGPEGHVFVTTVGAGQNNGIEELDADLRPIRTIGAATIATYPSNLVFAPDGTAYLSVYGASQVRRLGSDGEDLGTLPIAGLGRDYGAALGPDGRLYVSDSDNRLVHVVDRESGATIRTLTHPDLCCPSGLAFAPFRFRARLQGTLVRQDGDATRFADPAAVVSVSPGSGTVLVAVSELPARRDIPKTFPGTWAIVLHGADVAASDGRTRIFHGTSVSADPATGGVASIEVIAAGRTGTAGAFHPTSLSGSLHLARAGAALSVSFETSRRVP